MSRKHAKKGHAKNDKPVSMKATKLVETYSNLVVHAIPDQEVEGKTYKAFGIEFNVPPVMNVLLYEPGVEPQNHFELQELLERAILTAVDATVKGWIHGQHVKNRRIIVPGQ